MSMKLDAVRGTLARWRRWLPRLMPGIVFALGLVATWLVVQQLEQNQQAAARARFDREIERTRAAIAARMSAYEDLMHSANALFAADESVSREQWRTFVAALPLGDHYPGVTGLGMIVEVPRRLLAPFEASLRLDGVDNFQVHPRAERDLYLPVRYVEPVAGNVSMLGFDIAADPALRSAAESARDSGEATLTPRITIGASQSSEPGFLLLVPVYHRALPQGTLEQRRAALLGWVFAPIRSKALMQGILGPGMPEIDLEIFDGNAPQAGDLLYDSNAGMNTDYHPMFAENQVITVVGRPWKLGFTTLSDFDLSVDNNQPIVVGAAGVLISLLLCGVMLVVANNQGLADSRADRMTAAVRENARKLRRQNDFLAALQATRLGLLSHQRLEDTLKHIVERAAELAGTRHGYLFQLQPDGDEMLMRVGTGFFEQRVGDRIKPGQSVAGVAWNTGQPLVVNDYPNWPGRVPSPIFDQLASLAGVPLKLDERVVGVIGLGYVQSDAGSFAEDDMLRLAQIGELASLALENAHLFNQAETELAERTRAQAELRKAYDDLEQRVEERTAELRTLNQISLAINEQSDAADIAREVGEQLRHIFHTDNAYIALYDGQSNLISFPYVVRQGHFEKIKPLAFGPGMVSRILRTTQALVVRADAQQPPVDFEAELMGAPMGTYVGVPIMAGDEALGVIGVQGGEGEGTLAESDVRLLTTIAANVGVALGRSKLLQEAQQRARQEYLTRSIVTQISNSVDPSTILQTTARQLSHALGASHAVIRIGAPANASDGRGESPPRTSSD